MRTPITVARINVTPVKSTRLHHPSAVTVAPTGIVGDRSYFLVDRDRRLIVGSRCGPLVTVHADRTDDDHLTLEMPGGGRVTGRTSTVGDPFEVSFYGRPVTARLVPGPWDEALSLVVGDEVHLAKPDVVGDAIDDQPVTLIALASVEELARRERHDPGLDPLRFRMSFELEGCEPFEEDTWAGREVRIGAVVVCVGEQVPRCAVTTQDPTTGIVDFPTLEAIDRHRGRTEKGKLPFGVYASVITPGAVRVGDVVEPR